LPDVAVYAPAPETAVPEPRTFKCPQCGASTAYSAVEIALTCAHCGYIEKPDVPVVGRLAEEAEFKVETLQQADRGWGEARHEIYCESCGATLSLESTDLATTCPFCASHRVVARTETQRGLLRPGYLVPFQIDRPACNRLIRRWLAQGWMHPPELRRIIHTADLSGVYLSFWTFSARLDTGWQAEVGHKRTRRTWDGKRKTEIKWELKSGRRDVYVEDLLIPGSSRVSEALLHRIYPFGLGSLTVYDSAYLAGWRAHAYDVGLSPSWDRARRWMREKAKQRVYEDIDSKYIRNFSMTADLEEERWRYLLLPVYLTAYRFRGKAYQVLVNGQTGKVAGQKPVAWLRVMAALAALMAPALLLMVLGVLLPNRSGGLSLMIGWIALIIGGVLALRVLQQALVADRL
jgi:Zn finger protein HypA/HybF involved in hydrogenase expression